MSLASQVPLLATRIGQEVKAVRAVANSKTTNSTDAALRDRATHTGTQTAATISDFLTAVRGNRLDQMATPTADVSMGSKKITSLRDPDNSQDAATKSYVDLRTIVPLPSYLSMNIVGNGSFENWSSGSAPSQWGTFFGASTVSQGDPRTGTYSARATFSSTAGQTFDSAPFRIITEQAYYAEFWARRTSTAAGFARIAVACGKGTAVSPFGSDILEVYDTGNVSLTTKDVWQKIGIAFTPTNVLTEWAAIHCGGDGVNGTVLEFEDVTIVPIVKIPTQNISLLPTLSNIASGTSETIVAQFSLPPNYVTTGDVLEAVTFGYGSSTATLTPKLRFGPLGTLSDPILRAVSTSAAGANRRPHTMSAYAYVAGTGGSAVIGATASHQLGSTTVVHGDFADTTISIDTTVRNYFTVTLQQSATQAYTTLSGRMLKTSGVM